MAVRKHLTFTAVFASIGLGLLASCKTERETVIAPPPPQETSPPEEKWVGNGDLRESIGQTTEGFLGEWAYPVAVKLVWSPKSEKFEFGYNRHDGRRETWSCIAGKAEIYGRPMNCTITLDQQGNPKEVVLYQQGRSAEGCPKDGGECMLITGNFNWKKDVTATPNLVKSDAPPNPFQPGKKGEWFEPDPMMPGPRMPTGFYCYDPVSDVSEPCEDVRGARSPEEARSMVKQKARAHWEFEAKKAREEEASRSLGDNYAKRSKERYKEESKKYSLW